MDKNVQELWTSKLNLVSPLNTEMHRSIIEGKQHLAFSADPRNPSFQVKDENFILMTKRRLMGVNVVSNPSAKCALCSAPNHWVDSQADHPQRCAKVGRNSVHHPVLMKLMGATRDLLTGSATSIAKEVSVAAHLNPGHRVEKPRTDLTYTNHVTDKTTHLDLTFPIIKEDATQEVSSVHLAESVKDQHYASMYTFPTNTKVIPAVIDSWGRWGPQLVDWVKVIARSASSGERDFSAKVNRLRTTLAVAHANSIGNNIRRFLRNGNLYA